MLMLAVYAGIATLAVVLGVSSLNSARLRLRRLGLPVTFKNIFFLSSHEIEAQEREAKRKSVVAEVLWAKEIAGPELLAQMQVLVDGGASWEDAAHKVLEVADAAANPSTEERKPQQQERKTAAPQKEPQ